MMSWMLAERLTQISSVGGAAVTEVTAVAVMPKRRPSRPAVMIVTVAASLRMASLNAALISISGGNPGSVGIDPVRSVAFPSTNGSARHNTGPGSTSIAGPAVATSAATARW